MSETDPRRGSRQVSTLDLDEIEARCLAATDGPWRAEFDTVMTDAALGGTRDVATCWSDADAEFIARARTDLPLLLAEVRRLRAQVERVEAQDDTLLAMLSDPAYEDAITDAIAHHPGNRNGTVEDREAVARVLARAALDAIRLRAALSTTEEADQ